MTSSAFAGTAWTAALVGLGILFGNSLAGLRGHRGTTHSLRDQVEGSHLSERGQAARHGIDEILLAYKGLTRMEKEQALGRIVIEKLGLPALSETPGLQALLESSLRTVVQNVSRLVGQHQDQFAKQGRLLERHDHEVNSLESLADKYRELFYEMKGAKGTMSPVEMISKLKDLTISFNKGLLAQIGGLAESLSKLEKPGKRDKCDCKCSCAAPEQTAEATAKPPPEAGCGGEAGAWRPTEPRQPDPECELTEEQKPWVNLSYPFPKWFPMPEFNIVMETKPGACDLYGGPVVCEAVSKGWHFEPEYHVREVVLSIMPECLYKQCYSIDIGASEGSFALPMAAFGSEVAAVEAQPDMARAVSRTAAINCWSHRFKMLNAFISVNESARGAARQSLEYGARGRPYLIYPGSTFLKQDHECCPWADETITTVPVQDLVRHRVVHLIKIDIDSFDMAIVAVLEKMITEKTTEIGSITVEMQQQTNDGINAMYRLQSVHGYDIYCLNIHMDRRWINAKGIDVYANFTGLINNDEVEERFMQRLMRYVIYFKPANSSLALEKARLKVGCANVLITKEKLLEPRHEYPLRQGKTEVFKTAGEAFGYFNNKEGTV